MRPFVVNGESWRVVLVKQGDPSLIDRTGKVCLATTDPATRTISLSASLAPPQIDRVLLHEIAHAVTMSYGLLDALHDGIEAGSNVGVEEWAAQLVEEHAVEAAVKASEVLGRPVCIGGSVLPEHEML